MSKTMTGESFNSKMAGMKSKSMADKIGNLKKQGPIKAIVTSDKVKYHNCDYSSNKAKLTVTQPIKSSKQSHRQKRPHSSTFIGSNYKESDIFGKLVIMKPGQKPMKTTKTKKVNKRVRSASPGNLANYLTQKNKQTYNLTKPKVQRMIGGNLYQSNINPRPMKTAKPTFSKLAK
jgi:hypothetical protein